MLTVTLPGGTPQRVHTTPTGFVLNGQPLATALEAHSSHTATLNIGGRSFTATLQGWDAEKGVARLKINGKDVTLGIKTREDELLDMLGIDRAALLKVSELKAPMPGLVRRIVATPGEAVEAGAPLLVLEAMKMENVLKAPAPATVAEVCVVEGAAVEKGTVLVRFV